MSSCSSVVFLLVATILILNANQVQGKRGCSSYGHSCYGGMGKRASELNEEVVQSGGQMDENPAFVFTGPRSIYQPKSLQMRAQQYDNLSRVIRELIRKSQEQDEAI